VRANFCFLIDVDDFLVVCLRERSVPQRERRGTSVTPDAPARVQGVTR